ncbi:MULTISPECIES: TRAP transporter substrate-binding protein [unclassified Paenibacillus]|uniref:TRAP transporter substrate-binding protein n=1 Tax=unclassified Paenibacillus TaxID=185978 RepID=UPI001AE45DCE|nr:MULTISPECIES: TRAP transporter substrate-binding protein [unclassified Paenibacillus]MBP1155774.1 tripartite ATP-independent transporter DctP family solute receptor [Paenibacillus sp. PvP091]MBP1168840.1 tripartite ATP-independent transporter DctP family solute receptor [Paenibacillus sp. PvR098]MBP2439868.1 tripartite ATP-independent transporter DctP family solute receptor [Paenibacillus sp. PvP052]
MKKIFAILLTVSMVLFLASCSSGGTPSTPSPNASNNNTPTPANNDKKIIIKLGHALTETNFRHTAALKFKELVEQKSNGTMEVQVFSGEQLGSESAMLQSIVTNSIQATPVATGLFAKYSPSIGVIELPYLFENFEQAWKVLDGAVGKELADPLIGKGIRIISYWENGFRQITNSKKPIEKPEDLKGVKIRTPEIPVSLSVLKAMGANSLGMAYSELYPALEQHVVDGQENPLTNINASKFYEVQKYLSMTGHQYSPVPFAVSEAFWKTLSPDQQKIISDSGKEAGQMMRELVKQDDIKLKAELQTKGMLINEPDKKPFQEAVAPVYKEYESTYGKELIEKVRSAARQ